ncbi:hypothetical protein [Pseudarthrobacter sp. efr-133-R2A-89]|uniref:hypothetical protein n=1 Tax=Pseudarthrobacter sp. efr-133-R2A-89 TaxID=3040302 RepID=UPI0025525EC6|nr:hypothetical protein [Pseudarthrobacter sp. efr-133-R2A-89]
MTHLIRLEAWFAAHRYILEQHGQVTFMLSPPDMDNPSAHLLVALSKDSDVELLLWESGDAEFNRGPFTASVFEHVELESPEELRDLLTRFLDTVIASNVCDSADGKNI